MSEARKDSGAARPEAVGEALRSAVERTLAVTAESATSTRERAQDLLDDVVRRSQNAGHEVARRGQSAREEVARRGESATARLAEAIGELRAADREGLEGIAERLDAVERRLAALERRAESQSKPVPEVEGSRAEPDQRGDPRD